MTGKGWLACTVVDIAAPTPNALVGGPFGSNLVSSDYAESGIPVIRGQNMGPGRWIGGEFVFVSLEKAEQLRANLAHPGDLVFTQRGTLGQVAIVPEKPYDMYLVSQSQMKLTADPSKVDPHFLYYVFSLEEQRDYVLRNAIQTGVPHTNLGILRDTPLLLPSLADQLAIAKILGVLDDKIELNRRMNETLEGIARAIFKSWFVDFDPVRAKMEGREPYGMDAETAELFPRSFEESSAGLIPSGWRWGSIAEVATYVNGRNFTKDASGSGRMVIRIAELNSGPGASTVFNEVDAQRENVANPDDILFAWSGSLGVHRWHLDEALINQHIFKVVCDESSQWFVFYQLQESMEFFREIASHKATTMGHIKRGHLAEVAVALPPEELLTAASRIIDPPYRMIHVLERESQTLAALRDTLLSKLISGEVQLRDAEQMAEAGFRPAAWA